MDYLTANLKVCFQVDEFLGIIVAYRPCFCGVGYRGVIVYGEDRMVEDVEKKTQALRRVVEKYTGGSDAPFDGESLGRTAVVAIAVERMSGKKGNVEAM